MIFRHISEVKVHIYRQISGQKYEFPAFTGKITRAHSVYQALSPPTQRAWVRGYVKPRYLSITEILLLCPKIQ